MLSARIQFLFLRERRPILANSAVKSCLTAENAEESRKARQRKSVPMSKPVLMRKPARATARKVSLSEVHTALARIRESIYLSPCARSEYFSQLTGNSVYLKLDNLQRTGAFKERGALNKLLTLTADERSRGVIAASAGNHAQGVAYHAGRHGIHARIVMPLPTPLTKVSSTRAYGAEVVLYGTNYDEAYEKAVEQSRQYILTLIHVFHKAA